jgi:putative transposase
VLEPLVQRASGPGRPPTVDLREVVNALLYLDRTGCQWRFLPHDFPPWSVVRYYFDAWSLDGTWEQLTDQLVQTARVPRGRRPPPTAGVLDRQRVKTTEAGGARGDAGGKTRGRAAAALAGGHGTPSQTGGVRRDKGVDQLGTVVESVPQPHSVFHANALEGCLGADTWERIELFVGIEHQRLLQPEEQRQIVG